MRRLKISEFLTCAACVVLASILPVSAAPTSKMSNMKMKKPAAQMSKPNDTELTFISGVQQKLLAKYPNASDALKAGFIQMTGIGDDGTAIYFNRRFDGIDSVHPNFLWYDRNAKLVGLDYEYPVAKSPSPPSTSAYPVLPRRWTTVATHVHFAYRIGDGPVQRKGARVRPNLTGETITAQQLREDKLLPNHATLLWAYYHPKCWDLGFWLVPNPNGAFAELDPLIR